METVLSRFELLCFAVWFGSAIWVSFISGFVMFKTLPRHMFGRVQAKLFPRYFGLSAVCLAGIAAVALLDLRMGDPVEPIKIAALVVAALGVLINMLYLEPRATEIMYTRHEIERTLELGDKPHAEERDRREQAARDNPELARLNAAFGKLHGISSATNLLVCVAGLALLFFVG